MLDSFCTQIYTLNETDETNHQLNGLRLDLLRFQSFTSSSNVSFFLLDNPDLARIINSIMFHSKLVDSIESLLLETSDLSLFYSYRNLFFLNFSSCFSFPSQLRYSISFSLVCSHFISSTHEMCPEEVKF